MYTPSLLLVLAYIESEKQQSAPPRSDPTASSKRRAEEPELRLIDIDSQEEVSTDTISVSRFESLSSSDYHLSVLPAPKQALAVQQKGAMELLGNGLLDATMYPARLFSSAASIRSNTSSSKRSSENALSSFDTNLLPNIQAIPQELRVISESKSVKIFIHSPYDCVGAVEGDLTDHLAWLESHAKYEEAWNLVDQHPGAAHSPSTQNDSVAEPVSRSQNSLAEFFADDASSVTTVGRISDSIAEKEKRRIGELWIEQLVKQDRWEEAGAVCSKVINMAARWEYWTWVFIKKGKFDEITPHIPTFTRPPLASIIYEVILGQYVRHDRERFKELLNKWSLDLYDSGSVISAIEEQLRSTGMTEESKDWLILMESLAKLLLANGRHREALRCYIRLQDAETALGIIQDFRLVDAVADNIPGFIMLRVSKEQLKSAPTAELETAAAEPIKILVAEAYNGIVSPETVVTQLQTANKTLFLFFYLRALWKGEARPSELGKKANLRGRRAAEAMQKLVADEGRALVEPFADIALELFADYDRELFMEFLQSSTTYSFSTGCTVCEIKGFTPELVYLLSKTGETRKALNLILSDLQDVSQAIAFAKSQDDPDLWEDLLNYSMDKPRFIHGLLTEVGTSIDPIKLVRRIPSGLEIEGLRDGLTRMIREHDLQTSICEGAAKVMRSEVAGGMDKLRRGQRQGIKFDVITGTPSDASGSNKTKGTTNPVDEASDEKNPDETISQQGRCGRCQQVFHENGKAQISFLFFQR
jgi:vacuolar protein sorting-associated protein 41